MPNILRASGPLRVLLLATVVLMVGIVSLALLASQPPFGEGNEKRKGKGKGGPPGLVKPKMTDTIKANI